VKDNNTEKGRATVLYDLETGAPNLFNTHKWDTELIPSTDTPHIKISYTIEMGVWHDGAFQSVQEIPSVHFPLWIARDPKGQIDNGTEGMIATQMQAEMMANAN
jgi:hypothetical protein